MKRLSNNLFLLISAILLAALFKSVLILSDRIPFNADEAVVALMARHILQGEHPPFFYGQSYLGSLDAYLVAAGFAALGESVETIRIVQGLLYLALMVATAWLGKEVYGRWRIGVLAAFLLAIPNVNTSLYTTVSLGGYGEALLIGVLTMALGERLARQVEMGEGKLSAWGLWGALCGLGFWAFGLTLIFSLPVGAYMLLISRRAIKSRKAAPMRLLGLYAVVAGGFLAGAAPWWIFALKHGTAGLFGELAGGAIRGVEGLAWASSVGQHLRNLILFGVTVILGLRPPWEIRWLALPAAPFALAFWIAVGVNILQRLRRDSGQRIIQEAPLVMAALLLAAGFVFSPFGADPSGRYFLPLAPLMALWAGNWLDGLQSKAAGWVCALVGLVIAFHLWGTVECLLRFPPGLTTQFDPVTQVDHRRMDDLVEFLQENGEKYGYTNYWVSYPLAFRSAETLVFIPHLPYHQDFRYNPRDDRYIPYQEMVAAAPRLAYITTHHAALEARLRREFTQKGLVWEEKQIGDYRVFYHLSGKIVPAEMGLGGD